MFEIGPVVSSKETREVVERCLKPGEPNHILSITDRA
jgi:hypothetical protein